MVRLPGESDDQIMVWLPRWGALCCGDNYYGCFPNLYAIRGGQYRDIAAWIQSLDVIRSYPTQYLLPGHMEAIRGSQAIGEVLGNFRDAMDFVLTQTLQGMNQGRGPDELAAAIQLPPHYAQLPYLGEFYGCVEWTVRAIYAAYLGWFDGNPTHLHALAPQMRAEKMVGLLGGTQAVLQAIEQAMGQRDYQWCLELCDVVLDGDGDNRQALALKAEALLRIAEYETSANGRHYYIACAKEILPK